MKKLLLLCFVLPALLGYGQTRSVLVLSDLHTDLKLKTSNFYHTDADTVLLYSMIKNARNQRFPFILMPGDFLPHLPTHDTTDAKNTFQYLVNRVQSIDADAIILPALGNNDCLLHNTPDKQTYEMFYNSMLKRIDNDGNIAKTFKEGGYYAYTQGDLSVIVLNSLLFAFGPDAESEKEISWFGNILRDDRLANKRVWIIYHIPPGIDRYAKKLSWHPQIQQMYMDTVKKYAAIIKFQLAGHTHMNDLRLITDNGKLVSYIDLTPGLDTRNGNNPAYQVLQFNAKSKVIHEVSTFYTDSLNQYKWQSFSLKLPNFNFLMHYNSESKEGNDFVLHYSINRGPVKSFDGKTIVWDGNFAAQTVIDAK